MQTKAKKKKKKRKKPEIYQTSWGVLKREVGLTHGS